MGARIPLPSTPLGIVEELAVEGGHGVGLRGLKAHVEEALLLVRQRRVHGNALEGGAWGLVRASSNTPNLVIVVESPDSQDDMRAVFTAIKEELAKHPEIGSFDQEV